MMPLGAPNLSLEFSMGRKWTLDTQVGMNFFFYTKDAASSRYKTKKKSVTGLSSRSLRYWTCDVFNGWFFRLHVHGGQMNIGGFDIPFVLERDEKMKDYRYEGYFWGGGLSAGYQWVLSNRFNMRLLWESAIYMPATTNTN